jgi:hypothetical protein
MENKFVNRKLEKGGWSVPRAPVCYIYSFVWFWNIVDHWFKQEKKGKKGGGVNLICEFYS